MTDAVLSLLVLAVVVLAFVANRLPVEVVAIGSALLLWALGVVDLDGALVGFADPTVVLIAALFVVSEALDATGVTTWAGNALLARAGDDPRRLLLLVMLLVAGFTALINLNGAVAALLPMVVVLAVSRGIAPSRLLLPLAFAGSAGSLLLLTGSPVNVIVADAIVVAGDRPLGYAEFALVGVPLVAGTIVIVLLLGGCLLPERAGAVGQRDLGGLPGKLVRTYALDTVAHLCVPAGSPLVGTDRDGPLLVAQDTVRVVTILAAGTTTPVSAGPVSVGDRLTVVGGTEAIGAFAATHHLDVDAIHTHDAVARALVHRDGGVAEVVIPPRSRFLDVEVRPGQVLRGGALVVLAVQRNGHDRSGRVRLAAGDALLVEGPWDVLDALEDETEVLVVDQPGQVRRRAVPLGPRSRRAIAVLVGMVVLLVTGVVPAVVAALLAAGAMLVTRTLTVQQAYRGISWTTVLLVAGIIPLSNAIRETGAGEAIAERLVAAVGGAGPRVLLVALFVLTAAFGQLISNTATALIVIPIAVSAAGQLGVSPTPVLMSVLVASAAAFLTPVATPANLMVMGPGGYRFGDYWRLGLPLLGWFFVVAVGLVPVVWSF